MKAPTYSTTEVCKMTGATYRQLDYWCRMGRIPGQPPGSSHGSGGRRRWSTEAVREARRLFVAFRIKTATVDEILQVLDDVGATQRIEHELADRDAAMVSLGTGEVAS